MKKIKLLSVDAIKAIYEREMAKKGLPADCDETKLAEIVRNVEKVIPPGRDKVSLHAEPNVLKKYVCVQRRNLL